MKSQHFPIKIEKDNNRKQLYKNEYLICLNFSSKSLFFRGGKIG